MYTKTTATYTVWHTDVLDDYFIFSQTMLAKKVMKSIMSIHLFPLYLFKPMVNVWLWLSVYGSLLAKKEGSPYSITERRIPELIPVLGSQPAGDVSHEPGGRLPLLSARPAVTPATLKRAATNFAAWWTEAQWVWTVCLRLLPYSVTTAIWTRAFCAWVQHTNHPATEPPLQGIENQG